MALASAGATEGGEPLGTDVLDAAYRQLESRYDDRHGGFGGAPKFPMPHHVLFLLRHGRRHADSAAWRMVQATLRTMARGGIFDQVGFGFHRYATDAEWKVPHFEKMLYDQALLDGKATAYVCRDFACESPTTDPEKMVALLKAGSIPVDLMGNH